MLKDSAILYVLLSYATLCFSCKARTGDIYKDIDKVSTQTTTIAIEIPTYKSGAEKGKPDWIYAYIKKQTSELKLETLQAGYKDIQIRSWLHSWLAIKKDLIILSRTNQKWNGKLISATYKYNDIWL